MNTNNDIFDLQKDVLNQLRSSTEKFSYYIIGLSISSLAFITYQTKDAKIDYPKILLLLAVLFWSLSIYFGIHFIKRQQQGLLLSFKDYDNLRNQCPQTKNNPEKILVLKNKIEEELNEVSIKSKRNYKFQLNSFFVSVIFYVSWHIFEMYQNTIHSCCYI